MVWRTICATASLKRYCTMRMNFVSFRHLRRRAGRCGGRHARVHARVCMMIAIRLA